MNGGLGLLYTILKEDHQSTIQGSPHLQKTGRLDFSLRDHEREVKAWQGDFQQRHRHVFAKIWGFFTFVFLICIGSVNILLISFILTINSCFVFVLLLLLLILITLIFVDFRFFSFLSFLQIWTTSKCLFPSPDFLCPQDCHVYNFKSYE